MSDTTLTQKKYFYWTPPRTVQTSTTSQSNTGAVVTANAGPGLVAAFANTGTAGYLNLGLLFAVPPNQSNAWAQQGADQGPGVVGSYITILADTVDAGVIFGPTAASVSGANAPALASVGTVSAGVYTISGTECWRIPVNTSIRVALQQSVDLFMGYVGGTSGILRVYQSSCANV
jgi:hypothetical protein